MRISDWSSDVCSSDLTAGVDVELRRDMWNLVRQLRASGVTIILTTHYIEEDEEMADRVGVINKGEIILVEEKTALMKKLGRKTLTVQMQGIGRAAWRGGGWQDREKSVGSGYINKKN